MSYPSDKKKDTTYQKQNAPIMKKSPIKDSEVITDPNQVGFANKWVKAYEAKEKSAKNIGIKAALKQGADIAMKKYF
jgi:hypothetical protein